MFNDKKLKIVSDAVSKIMEASMKEELKGDQHKIDANKNNKVDAHDFKLLRAGKKVAKEEVEQVEEGIEDKLEAARAKAKAAGKPVKGPAKAEKSNVTKVAGKAYGGSAQKDDDENDEDDEPKKASKKGVFKRRYNTKVYKEQFSHLLDSYINGGLKSVMEDLEVVEVDEEVEQIDEGKMNKMSLSGLWHKHAEHSYLADQGYGHGTVSMHHNATAATAIENHVRKHHGNKVADNMVSHSDHHVAVSEYAGPGEAEHHEKEMAKLRKQHGIKDDNHGVNEEVDNETFTKEVEAQKAKAAGKGKKADIAAASVQAVTKEEAEQVDELSKSTYVGAMQTLSDPDTDRGHHDTDDKLISRAKKQHGEKFAKDLQGVYKTHWPRANQADGRDKLKSSAAVRTTQSGKANKQDVKTKSKEIQSRLGTHKKPNLPEQVEERTLTEPEMNKREDVVKGMKKNIAGFKERYGSRAKDVMYATATKVAKGDK